MRYSEYYSKENINERRKRMALQREAVRFNGRPQAFRLKYATGKECSNGSYLYSLEGDERALFAPPDLDREIQAAGSKHITIQLGPGKTWNVQRVDDPPASGPGFSAPASSQAGVLNMSNDGNKGTTHPSAPATPAPACLMTGQSQFILQQLIAAIEAVHAAEKYAAAMNRPVQFSSEDIRCFAISCFIQQSRGGH